MRGPYPGELRRRVIGFVEAGGSRREAAEHFDIGVSSAIRWMQRFCEDGTCEPMPRGGSTSPLEEYAQQILALNREQTVQTYTEQVGETEVAQQVRAEVEWADTSWRLFVGRVNALKNFITNFRIVLRHTQDRFVLLNGQTLFGHGLC
jgi:transposase